jgi:hypothetical protein
MAPPPSELIDDAIAEILLRLPPDDPACLVRASLVCQLWRRILSDSTFPHRYREFHRTPPLLGLLGSTFSCASKASRFDPITTRIPFLEPAYGCRALDCRHGRVLFDMVGGTRGSLVVWDPITGDHKVLSDPDPDSYCHSGTVLCAAASCNHRCGCHGDGPFQVVFVSTPYNDDDTNVAARAWVYSSETAAWSATASVQLPEDSHLYTTKRGALVGDQIYFLLTDTRILKYDLGKHCLTTICLPGMYTNCHPDILMTMDDGSSLGFVVIKDSTLDLWARKVNLDGSMGWVQDRVVLLNNLIPIIPRTGYTSINVIGFAFLLLGDDASGFMFELKSGRFKRLSNPEYNHYDVLPYLSFYIPGK